MRCAPAYHATMRPQVSNRKGAKSRSGAVMGVAALALFASQWPLADNSADLSDRTGAGRTGNNLAGSIPSSRDRRSISASPGGVEGLNTTARIRDETSRGPCSTSQRLVPSGVGKYSRQPSRCLGVRRSDVTASEVPVSGMGGGLNRSMQHQT